MTDGETLAQLEEDLAKILKRYGNKVLKILKKYEDDEDIHFHIFKSFRVYDSLFWMRAAANLVKNIEDKEQL